MNGENEARLQRVPAGRTIASVFLLPDCDMACRFCASQADFSVATFAQASWLLQALARRAVRDVVLGGGEPFQWPHGLVALTGVARDLGQRVQVCTNGLPLPPGFERIPSIDRYILPVESMDPAVHDALRAGRPTRGTGHHAIVLDRLERLRAAGRAVAVSTVVTARNRDALPGIAAFLRDLGARGARVDAWHLYRVVPVGRAGSGRARDLELPLEAFRDACRAVRSPDLPFRIYRRDDMTAPSSVEFFRFDGERLRVGLDRPDPAVGAG